MTTTISSSTPIRSEPSTSSPTSAATPSIPSTMPIQLLPLSLAGRPKKNATATPTSGMTASSSPAVELGRCSSAVLRKNQGMMISIAV